MGFNRREMFLLRLNGARDGITSVPDGVMDTARERDLRRFGSGFGVVTEFEIGPDGALGWLFTNCGGAIGSGWRAGASGNSLS